MAFSDCSLYHHLLNFRGLFSNMSRHQQILFARCLQLDVCFVFRNFGWVLYWTIHFTIWSNNPSSCLLPLYHNESSWETIHFMQIKLVTKSRFETEAHCNCEMTRWWYQSSANWTYHQGPIPQTGFGSFFPRFEHCGSMLSFTYFMRLLFYLRKSQILLFAGCNLGEISHKY